MARLPARRLAVEGWRSRGPGFGHRWLLGRRRRDGQHDADASATTGEILGERAPAVCLRELVDDCEAEAGAWPRARRVGAIEALEHVDSAAGGMPGPSSRTARSSAPSGSPAASTETWPPGRGACARPLATRLARIRSTAPRSAAKGRDPATESASRVWPSVSARPAKRSMASDRCSSRRAVQGPADGRRPRGRSDRRGRRSSAPGAPSHPRWRPRRGSHPGPGRCRRGAPPRSRR